MAILDALAADARAWGITGDARTRLLRVRRQALRSVELAERARDEAPVPVRNVASGRIDLTGVDE